MSMINTKNNGNIFVVFKYIIVKLYFVRTIYKIKYCKRNCSENIIEKQADKVHQFERNIFCQRKTETIC